MLLKDKVIIVTEAVDNAGKPTVIKLTKEGANVIGISRNEGRLGHVLDIVKKYDATIEGNGTFTPVGGDITNPDEVKKLFDLAMEKFGKVDGLVNIVGDANENVSADQTTDEIWYSVLKEDLTTPMQTIRAALEAMKEAGGAIVNISVINVEGEQVRGFAQSAARLGLIGMSKSVAKSCDNVRCNMISARRDGKKADGTIADTTAFLLSSAAKAIDGDVISVK